MRLEPRSYESETHGYLIEHWTSDLHVDADLRHERTVLKVRKKKTGSELEVMLPVEDSGIVGDLVTGVYLERKGFERMEVSPGDLQGGDVIEGLGPIVEIEEITGMTTMLIKVMVQMRPPHDDSSGDFASVLFSQENATWLSKVGITRPID